VSISAPRYVVPPTPRTGRASRLLAIADREFFRHAEWGTLLAVGFAYTATVLATVTTVLFASLAGSVALDAFATVFASPLWPFLILIVTTAAGAGCLAEDVGNGSFTLYRARPVHLVDYLAAKTVACGSWLVIASVGPGLVAVAVTAALGYAEAGLALHAAAAFVATGLLAAVFFTGLALALSSLTDRALYAGVAIFGLVLSLYIGGALVAGLTGNPYVPYGSPIEDLHRVAIGAFQVSGTSGTSPAASAGVLAGAGIALWAFAGWRLTRLEVIAE